MTQAILKEKRDINQEEEIEEHQGFDKAFKAVASRKSTTNFLNNFIKVKPKKNSPDGSDTAGEVNPASAREAWLKNWKRSGVSCAETPNLFTTRTARRRSQVNFTPKSPQGM